MEEPGEAASLGSSLLVPSVQELAKDSLTTVPPRYLRPEQDPPFSSQSTSQTPLPHIPIIDFHCFAFRRWHGVRTGEVAPCLQGMGFLPDLFFMVTLPPHLRKPHLFPKLPLPFRDTLEVYAVELRNLAMAILGFMAKALKMEAKAMKALFEEGLQSMRMNYYPPCPQPDQVIGLTPHSDSVGFTLLLQVNEMQGLQVRKNGIWIPIKALPDAFVVNIGDILEIVTIEHRAVVNSVKERLSIATFYSPKLEGDIGPAPSLVTPHSPALFKNVSVADYIKGLFSRELHGRSYLDVLKIDSEAESN
ncbi:Protein SRG1 [Vitis vinifera]|uniref:Protein SRG1 n=2 Tax=Vitis vinifera TaxID=29760 RepID=A0A438JPC7_VITVI|nr:Protein SRG1 [Vitis vinifera]